MKTTQRLAHELPIDSAPELAHLSATVDKTVLIQSKAIARVSGYRFSFSRYVNDLLARDIQTKAGLLALRAHP